MNIRMQKRIVVPFVDASVDAPIIKAYYGVDKFVYALVDTGSEISMIDKNFVESTKKMGPLFKDMFFRSPQPEKMQMIGLAGIREVSVVKTTTLLHFEDISTADRIKFTAIEMDFDMISQRKNAPDNEDISIIIGNDFLTKRKAKLDFGAGELSIRK